MTDERIEVDRLAVQVEAVRLKNDVRHVIGVTHPVCTKGVGQRAAAPEAGIVANPHAEREVIHDGVVGQHSSERVPLTGRKRGIK